MRTICLSQEDESSVPSQRRTRNRTLREQLLDPLGDELVPLPHLSRSKIRSWRSFGSRQNFQVNLRNIACIRTYNYLQQLTQ
jgi:hypothetical protein